MPFEYFVGRLSEELCCPPSVAYQEYLAAPAGFIEQLLEYRHFARCYGMYEAASTQGTQAVQALPTSPLMTMVQEFEFEAAHEAQRQAEARRRSPQPETDGRTLV